MRRSTGSSSWASFPSHLPQNILAEILLLSMLGEQGLVDGVLGRWGNL